MMRPLSDKKLQEICNKAYTDNMYGNPNDDEKGPYENASVFLNGSCQLFGRVLNIEYGYEIFRLKTSDNSTAHFFCETASRNGEKLYIDVRGIFDNRNKLLRTFLCDKFGKEKPHEVVPATPEDYEAKSKIDLFGLDFARQIIKNNPERYNVNLLN